MQKLTKKKAKIKRIISIFSIPVCMLVFCVGTMMVMHMSLLFGGVAIDNVMDKKLGADEKTVKEKIDIEQFIEKDKTGKYKQLSKQDVKDLVGETEYETEVHVYESKEGVGYQIIYTDYQYLEATSTETGYTRVLRKSVGYGPESELRTHDWQ